SRLFRLQNRPYSPNRVRQGRRQHSCVSWCSRAAVRTLLSNMQNCLQWCCCAYTYTAVHSSLRCLISGKNPDQDVLPGRSTRSVDQQMLSCLAALFPLSSGLLTCM
ncbi:unnamed protein product, partial [Ectocarpus sp. 12 AP-2014]